jgi:hypothetical protein
MVFTNNVQCMDSGGRGLKCMQTILGHDNLLANILRGDSHKGVAIVD